jgi:hypothetical protein
MVGNEGLNIPVDKLRVVHPTPPHIGDPDVGWMTLFSSPVAVGVRVNCLY